MRPAAVAIALGLLLAAGAAVAWFARTSDEEGGTPVAPPGKGADPAAEAGAFDLGDHEGGFRLEVPPAAPTGDPRQPPRRPPVGLATRTTGTFRYVQRPAPGAERGVKGVRRSLSGDVEARATVSAGGPGGRRVDVEGTLRLVDVAGDAAPRERTERFTLSFDVAARGGAERRSQQFRAPDDLRDLLGTLVAHWTDAPPLPDRPVRVGEVFEPPEVVDVDPWRRTMWELFQKGNPERPPVVVAVEGGGWVAAFERQGGEEVVVVKTSLAHAHVAEAGPFGAGAVKVGYAASERSTRRLALADGLEVGRDLVLRRRLRARGKGEASESLVDTLERVALATTRLP